MASSMTKYLAFLVTVHTFFYFAGAGGYVDHQDTGNPHKKFVSNFKDENVTKEARVEDSSGILDGTFRTTAKSLNGFNRITGILVSPYTVWDKTGLPTMFVWLGQGLFGVIELTILVEFLRGVLQ